MENITSFGHWLRKLRRSLDLTQEELARCAGCVTGTIKSIEADERRPSKQLAARLADCLNMGEARAVFIKAARAELAVDRVVSPTPPAAPLPIGNAATSPSTSSVQNVSSTPLHPMPQNAVCPNCNATVALDRRFCGQCGTPLIQSCPVCGTELPSDHRFCSSCGATLIAQIVQSHTEEIVVPALVEERRWVTVLYADIADFAALSARMDPEDLGALVSRCTERMAEQVRRFDGTVVNMIGDAMLAVFGAPLAHEDDAARAVRAAISIRDDSFLNHPTYPFKLHIGIHTGEVLATVSGLSDRRDYTVLGDTVNMALQFLRAAPPGTVLVGAETYRATKHAADYRELPSLIVKGREQRVFVWEALSVAMLPEARQLRTTHLVGREHELSLLKMLWERAVQATQPHLVTILGEPGIGKSRLTAEFKASLPADTLVLTGRCLPYGTTLGYWAFATMLKEAVSIGAEDGAESARAKLDVFVANVVSPGMGDWGEIALHLALLTGLDTEADRAVGVHEPQILHASARRFLEALALQHPLCVVFEDIHWADDALLDLIELIAARIHAAPLLIVTQTRPELLEKRPAWARGVRSSTTLLLNPLSDLQERELMQTLCRERGLPDAIVTQIGRGVGGNPLFAEEIVATIAEHGHLAGIPSALKTLIAARLDALPMNERRTLQLAAVFGRTFREAGVHALNASSNGDIHLSLDALEQRDLLRSQKHSQFHGEREYIFKHDMIRDVAYELLPKSERRVLHGRVVEWLEQCEEIHLDLLAYHAIEARKQEQAVNYLIRAAERASYAAVYRQEVAFLSEALKIAEHISNPNIRASLLAKRGAAYIKAGMWANAKSDLEIAQPALAPDRVGERAQALLNQAIARFWLADIAGLHFYATEALALAEQVRDTELAAAALAHLALAEQSDGHLDASGNLMEKAVVRAGGLIPAMGVAASASGLRSYWLGRLEDAVRYNRDSTETLRTWHNKSLYITSFGQWGMALAASGHYTEAAQIFAEAIRLGREYEIWPFVARTLAMSAGFHLDLFDYAGNAALAEEARQVANASNFSPPAASAGIDLLLNFARCHEVERAEALLPEIVATAENAAGFHGWLWRLRLAEARAEIALARGVWQEALLYADSAIEQSRSRGRLKYHILGLDTRAKALLELDRTRDALDELRLAVTLARSLHDPAVFLRPTTTLLSIEGNDALLKEANATVQRIIAAIPTQEMRHLFETAEPIQKLTGRTG